MPLYNDNPDGDWTAAHLALFHRFADYLTDSDRFDKPPLVSPPQYNNWVYEIRECHRGVKGLPPFSDDYSGPIPRKALRKSGFRLKTRGFFNKFRGHAHVDSYVPDYDNRNGKCEHTRSRDGRDVRTHRDSRSADRSDARDRSPIRVAARSLEQLSKRAKEEKRAYNVRDVTMKDVEHTSTVAKASGKPSQQPSSSANLVETIASLNITAPRPSSTFSFNPQTSGSAAVTTSILGASSAEDKGKDKEPNPTMIPLPESDNEGEDDAMRGK
ncbi:hypothetical protein B0H14DRAFT_2890718 [Mycena olivaceomarginata]|nr:hypothetical protein B0H14DRAFT_2890718 [Mycena olivaceomarginata]